MCGNSHANKSQNVTKARNVTGSFIGGMKDKNTSNKMGNR